VKLGLEFFCANGEEGVLRIAERAMPIFLDLKFHDIPNTVGKAVAALAHLEPAILTVHAAGGREMLAAAKEAASPKTKVVAVTVLTSLDAADLAEAGVAGSPADQVLRLADLAQASGIDGIVCSGGNTLNQQAIWKAQGIDLVLRQAWDSPTAEQAERVLKNLARRLDHDAPGVSASILEGLDEMLTVIRIDLPDQLRRSLGCTNAIESLMAVLRTVCRNVKRWRDARMALRWTGTSMLEAEKSFRRLKAHKQLPILRAALLRHQQALRGDQPIGSKNLAA